MTTQDGTPDTEPKSERFNMFISKSEMDAINEWAWENRIRSRSEAVRRLVQIGLRSEEHIGALSEIADVSNKRAGELERELKQLLEAHKEPEAMGQLAVRALLLFLKEYGGVRWSVSEFTIKIFQLKLELAMLNQEGVVDEVIKEAEQKRESFKKYWKKYSSIADPSTLDFLAIGADHEK